MADSEQPSGGYPDDGFGSNWGPGYGMTFTERLKNSVGKNVTVYVGEESTPVMGKMHAVGSDYVEVHQMSNMNNEAMLIPLQAIMAVSAPWQSRS